MKTSIVSLAMLKKAGRFRSNHPSQNLFYLSLQKGIDMKFLVDIKDSKADFVMELLNNFSFVKAKPLSKKKGKVIKGI